jgi:hypothetical protein
VPGIAPASADQRLISEIWRDVGLGILNERLSLNRTVAGGPRHNGFDRYNRSGGRAGIFILAKRESQYAGETRAAKYQSVIYQLML